MLNSSFPYPPRPGSSLLARRQTSERLSVLIRAGLQFKCKSPCASLSEKFVQTQYSCDFACENKRRFICIRTHALLRVDSKEQFITAFKLNTGVAERLGYGGMPPFLLQESRDNAFLQRQRDRNYSYHSSSVSSQ